MNTCKILCLFAICLLCVTARCIKRQKRIRQQPEKSCGRGCLSTYDLPCGCVLEPTYSGLGTCNCQSIFLDERIDYGCGCKYVDSYGVLPEVSNYDRVPAIKLPRIFASYDAGVPIPAINLPGLYDLAMELPPCPCQRIPSCGIDFTCPCQTIPSCGMDFPCPCQTIPSPYVMEFPCSCQASLSQIIETPCCRYAPPIVDYLSPCDIPSPIVTVPFAEPCYVPPPKCKVVQLPSCGCSPQTGCGCPKVKSCQKVITCDGYEISYGLPCGCQNPSNCGCLNVVQLPGSCPCQTCQSPVSDLPVFGHGCQLLPPPEIGCGGKYLRQVTLQPPFM